jgi:hypothetical protein
MIANRFHLLLRRIAAAERVLTQSGETSFLKEDADNLTEELLEQSAHIENLSGLSKRLAARREMDLSSLRSAVNVLRAPR